MKKISYILLMILLTTIDLSYAGNQTKKSGGNEKCLDLIYAYINNKSDNVRAIIDSGCDIDLQVGERKTTLLIHAAGRGKFDAVKLLCENGADVNAKDIFDRTALMMAAMKRKPDTIELLLSHGADVNTKDQDDNTALMLAVKSTIIHVADLFLNYRRSDNRRSDFDKFENGPLIKALYNDLTDTVKLLLSHGADINIKDDHGDTALTLAERRGYNYIFKLLKEAVAKE